MELKKFRFLSLFLLVWVLNNCHFSCGLDANPPPQFTIFSLPEEGDDVKNTVDNFQEGDSEQQQPDISQPLSWKIRDGMNTTEPSNSGTPKVHINLRSRSLSNNGNLRQKTLRDGIINWDEAYASSVKRVVVRTRLGSDGTVPHNRNIVKLQPIVPRVPTSSSLSPSPPPHEQVAKMARFIVRNSNWTSMSTISTRSPISGFPFANIISISDGPPIKSTGIPYMYMTPLDMSAIDLKVNSKSSLTMSLAQGDYCKSHSIDVEDPRCARIILTGNIVELNNSTVEANFAKEALFSRHPDMQSWPKDHGWFFAKLQIINILVLDYFGGAKSVTVDDYMNALI